MRSKIGLAYLILIALATGSCATNRTCQFQNCRNPLSVQTVISDGSLVYGLPLTVIDIEIEANG